MQKQTRETKRLKLNKETVRRLTSRDLSARVFGGLTLNTYCRDCDSQIPGCTAPCAETNRTACCV